MDVRISFRHMDSSPTVEEKIQQKCQRLKKFFAGDFQVSWICTADKLHKSDVTVSGEGTTCHASAENDSLGKTLDLALEKLEGQLAKQKGRRC